MIDTQCGSFPKIPVRLAQVRIDAQENNELNLSANISYSKVIEHVYTNRNILIPSDSLFTDFQILLIELYINTPLKLIPFLQKHLLLSLDIYDTAASSQPFCSDVLRWFIRCSFLPTTILPSLAFAMLAVLLLHVVRAQIGVANRINLGGQLAGNDPRRLSAFRGDDTHSMSQIVPTAVRITMNIYELGIPFILSIKRWGPTQTLNIMLG